MTKLLLTQYYWLPLVPFAATGGGMALISFLSRGRWMVHIGVVTALLMAPLISLKLRAIADPTLVGGSKPGDGLLLLAYSVLMVAGLIVYSFVGVSLYLSSREAKRNQATSTTHA